MCQLRLLDEASGWVTHLLLEVKTYKTSDSEKTKIFVDVLSSFEHHDCDLSQVNNNSMLFPNICIYPRNEYFVPNKSILRMRNVALLCFWDTLKGMIGNGDVSLAEVLSIKRQILTISFIN